jgi:hypothetical protein
LGLAANGPIVYSEDGDIYSRDLATGTVTPLVGGPEVDVGPSFAPDGSRFSFVRVTSDEPAMIALMVANADGSDVQMVVEPDVEGDFHWFTWSPDSDMFVVRNSADGVPPLSVVNVTGEPERRALDVPLEVHQVDWRLGGDELFFLGKEPEAGSSPRALYAVGLDGTGLRQLVPAPDSETLAGGAFTSSSTSDVSRDKCERLRSSIRVPSRDRLSSLLNPARCDRPAPSIGAYRSPRCWRLMRPLRCASPASLIAEFPAMLPSTRIRKPFNWPTY